MAYRLDRSTSDGLEIYSKYELKKEKPAVLVLDSDGELLYTRQFCTEPNHCEKSLKTAVKTSNVKIGYSKTAPKKLAKIEKNIAGEQFVAALKAVRLVKPERLVLPLRSQLTKLNGALEKAGKQRLEKARTLEEEKKYDEALTLYKSTAKDFSRLKDIGKPATAGVQRVLRLRRVSEKQRETG